MIWQMTLCWSPELVSFAQVSWLLDQQAHYWIADAATKLGLKALTHFYGFHGTAAKFSFSTHLPFQNNFKIAFSSDQLYSLSSTLYN